MKRELVFPSLVIASCGGLIGCDLERQEPADILPPSPPLVDPEPGALREGAPSRAQAEAETIQLEAEAELQSAQGMKVEGDIELRETEKGVKIVAQVQGLSPGKHGIHIHEKGDCSDIPGKSMGDHLNPSNHDHKLPADMGERHLGDLGNISVDDKGEGKLEIVVKDANLQTGGSHSLLGKSIVLHSGKDLGEEKQPAGDSGPAVACGVIRRS